MLVEDPGYFLNPRIPSTAALLWVQQVSFRGVRWVVQADLVGSQVVAWEEARTHNRLTALLHKGVHRLDKWGILP